MTHNKSKIAFNRKLLIATLIDSNIGSVPLLVDATGMNRRTVQEVINSLSDIDITCLRSGSTKSGYYFISDWGLLDKRKVRNQLQHINGVLEYLLNKQLVLDLIKGIPMSEQRLMQAMFNQQRLQIMSLGVHHGEFTDAYLYAWEQGVYPFFEDTDGSVNQMPHEVYAEFFQKSKDKVDKLSKLLDDLWLKNEVPTFYELEDMVNVRCGSSEWERMDLIKICRYMYLMGGTFDDNFWNTLLTPTQHPSEASSIKRKFNRKEDLYFM